MTYNLRQMFVELDLALSQNPNLRLEEFAQHLHVDRHTVDKSVREAVGVCFRQYKMQKLLREAHHLLKKEFNLTEKEIAYKLGYRSPDAFCRFIKINTGRSPGDVRRAKMP